MKTSYTNKQKLQRLTTAGVLAALSLVLMATIRFPIFPSAPFYEMEFSDVPILMLTAKGDDMDKILGLEYGADDYITKPFNILEVKARIKAITRRTGKSAQQKKNAAIIHASDMTLDTDSKRLYIGNKEINLTSKEFDVLELLVKNPDKVYSREKLLGLVWGSQYPGDVRTVDVHIRRLREKIEANPSEPKYVHTKWGVGYYFKG